MEREDTTVRVRGLLKRMDFSEMADRIAELMCKTIVNGKRTGYLFLGSEGYFPVKVVRRKMKVDRDPAYYTDLDELSRGLMEKANLLMVRRGKYGSEYLKPTAEALRLYRQLKAEGKLDERGYLKRESSTSKRRCATTA